MQMKSVPAVFPSPAAFPAPPPLGERSASIPPALSSLSSLLDEDTAMGDDVELAEGDPDPYVGTVLGDRYVVGRVIGQGGMGKVYRAHHKVIKKKVAIKVLHAELARDKESVGRFLREARAASAIGNAHIVDIVDFGEAPDGATYFVMEYLNGQALGDLLEDAGRLTAKQTVDFALQICDGLAAAHAEGITHRDLKPDNVLLVKPKGTWAGQGLFVKILDFGIAKVSDKKGNSSKLTMAGAVFGTPHYMSPEQASGEAVDGRTDIYALGVMMYEMLSGDVPFRAENFMAILTQHMHKAPPPLHERIEGEPCPPALESIVMRCMAKSPEHRYQSMEQLAADLLVFKQTGDAPATSVPMSAPEPSSAVVTPPAPLSAPAASSSRLGLAIGGFLVTSVAIGAAVLALRAGGQQGTSPAASAVTATASSASGAASERGVLLFSDASDAHAVVDGRRVKLPETFNVVLGKRLAVRVEAGPDYEATTVEVDGTNPKVKVDLKRIAAPVTSASAATTASATPLYPYGTSPYGAPTTRTPFGQPPTGYGTVKPPVVKPKTNPSGVVDPW
ncbi:MAG: serine/threonine protein kinase [Deltaproteobacteria bacterium]|nr:serine/threonine protein kinase [Deltaproteobacteria bacterium]